MQSLGLPLILIAALGAFGVSACSSRAEEEEAGSASSALGSIDVAQAERALYLDAERPASCANEAGDERVRCLVRARYEADPAARDLALTILAETGGVSGVAPEETYAAGYRGTVHLVPELPTGAYRRHLVLVRDAMRDFGTFFGGLAAAAPTPMQYRWSTINFRFFRSVGRTTPSAFTEGTWEAFYNVSGSLVGTPALVRETLFHEFFHINDWNHDQWSSRVLAPIVTGIVARCGTNKTCLAPYAPTDTTVRGGTYYAFQPNNGAMELEYAAELASRYYVEQKAAMANQPLAKRAFKCGPTENAQAWDAMVREFFGGADLVPPCSR